MRFLIFVAAFAIASCSTTRSVSPREYLDELTAATITVVADPWIFSRADAPPQQDFFHLYAIDVNRMGDHRKYFALVHYWPGRDLTRPGRPAPTLVLTGGLESLEIEPASEDAHQLGLGEPIDRSAPASSRTWFYPIEQQSLRALAESRDLAATLIADAVRAEYAVWRDGSSELSEFAAAFPTH